MVYTPKGLLPHAASLDQACAHCPRFVAAASRRSLGSVSVPVRRANLSVPVPVVALVSRYLTNKLIGHGPLPSRQARRSPPLTAVPYGTVVSSSITPGFPGLSSCSGYVTHVFLALSPLYRPSASLERSTKSFRVRLACLSHAASVRSEPGSNPLVDYRPSPERNTDLRSSNPRGGHRPGRPDLVCPTRARFPGVG